MCSRRVTLRDSRRSDLPRIQQFYEANRHPNLVLHPAEDLEEAIDNGYHLIVEHNGEIVAAACAIQVEPAEPFVEIGNALVAKPFRGFRLHELLVEARVAAITTAGFRYRAISGCKATADASKGTLVRSGFLPWWKPIEGLYKLCRVSPCPDLACANLRGRRCCCDFFVLWQPEQRDMIRRFLARVELAPLQNTDGDTLHVSIETRTARDPAFRCALQDFGNDVDL